METNAGKQKKFKHNTGTFRRYLNRFGHFPFNQFPFQKAAYRFHDI